MKWYDKVAFGFLGTCALVAMSLGVYISTHKSPVPIYTATIEQMRSETVVLSMDNSAGSGVIISPTEVLTARHVVEDAKGSKITVEFFNGERLPAIVEWTSKDADLAIVTLVVPKEYQIAPIACRSPIADEQVVVVGSPEMFRWVVSRGTILTDRPVYIPDSIPANVTAKLRAKFIEVPFDAVVAPGSSGGPVFDSHGNVIGDVEAIMIEVFGTDEKTIQGSTINLMVPSKFFCGSELKKA